MGGAHSLNHTLTSCDGFPVDKYDYRWTVSNLQKLFTWGAGSSTSTSVYTSFVKGDVDRFKLFFYPNGTSRYEFGYSSLLLQYISNKRIVVKFTCALLDDKGREIIQKDVKQKIGIDGFIGWRSFCHRNDLLYRKYLTFEFSIQIFHKNAIPYPKKKNESCEFTILTDLSDNLGSLLLDGAYHDFTIYVDYKACFAHKAILSARSPVMRAMLQSKSTKFDTMTITDISEPIVKEMLGFIYSGKTRFLTFQEASELYYAADKYEINCLKVVCRNVIMNNINVENILDTLVLSERHSDVELQEICITFVVNNAAQVQNHADWMEFLKNQPELANKIFKRLASRKK